MKHSIRDAHLLSFAIEHPWAITPAMLAVISGIIARHIAGIDATDDEIQAALVNRQNLPQPTAGGSVALIRVHGVIAPRMNMLSDISGGTTFESLSGQLREAVANKSVRNIVLDIDSPGGSVQGASEFAREVMAARTKRPIIAQVQHVAASAAYWLASAATKIVASPSAHAGSIGVYTAHSDISDSLKQLGVKRTYISAGKGKVDGLDGPLSDDGLARIQALVDGAYDRMVGDIVKGRGKGLTAEQIRNDWKAHVYAADEAKNIGMVDEIATLEQTLASLAPTAMTDSAAALDTAQEPERVTAQDRSQCAEMQLLEAELLDL